jgi:uncharacterized protein
LSLASSTFERINNTMAKTNTTTNSNTNSKDSSENLPFEVRNSKIQGRGVFATRRIRTGQRLIEYIGERITHDEADKRYDDDSMARHHTFLFEIDDENVIDAGRIGNDARYINHSCDPNCEAVNEGGRIFVESIRNIQPETELTYDYSYEHEGELPDELRQQYLCLCGKAKCRGTILKVKQRRKRSKSRKTSAGKKSAA